MEKIPCSNLPSKKKRTASVSANDSSVTVRVMHRAMDKAASAVAEILVGAEKDSFIKTWHETTAGNEDVLACIETLLGVLRRGSAEHDILSAVIATGARDSDACQNFVQNAASKRLLWNTIVNSGGEIPVKPKRTVKRCSDAVVESAVTFILDPTHTNMLSWGLKKLTVDGTTHEIPALSRRMSKASLWADHQIEHPDKRERLGEESFRVLMKSLSAKQDKSVNAVDYKISELVHENKARMQRLIRGEIPDLAVQKTLLLELDAVLSYIKSSFGQHVATTNRWLQLWYIKPPA
jgi:hypothetical protein